MSIVGMRSHHRRYRTWRLAKMLTSALGFDFDFGLSLRLGPRPRIGTFQLNNSRNVCARMVHADASVQIRGWISGWQRILVGTLVCTALFEFGYISTVNLSQKKGKSCRPELASGMSSFPCHYRLIVIKVTACEGSKGDFNPVYQSWIEFRTA